MTLRTGILVLMAKEQKSLFDTRRYKGEQPQTFDKAAYGGANSVCIITRLSCLPKHEWLCSDHSEGFYGRH